MNIKNITLIVYIFLVSGCAHYTTPGGAVQLNEIAQGEINELMSTQPAANFPANVSVVRIQASGYRNHHVSSFGSGRYSIVTTKEVELESDFNRLAQLSGISRIAPLNKLFLPNNLNSIKALRLAAARLKTDIIMIYTFDTSFHVGEQSFAPLNLIALGFLSNKSVSVTTTVSAAFFDVRTEYLYGIAESTCQEKDFSNVWSSENVVDDLRLLTEKNAFQKLIPEIEKTWSVITKQYANNEASSEAKHAVNLLN